MTTMKCWVAGAITKGHDTMAAKVMMKFADAALSGQRSA
jgi:hypothetical protein